MKKIIEKIVDFYLNRNIKNRVILLLVVGGLYLTTQSILGIIFEEWLKREFNIAIPNFIYFGLILIFLGLAILYHEINYSFLPSMFNTLKTTRVIYLGRNTYQFVFDKKMRCPPTICFAKPDHMENQPVVKHIDEHGFIVRFEADKEIMEIRFWADAWDGLNFRQSLYIKIANLFRTNDDKIIKGEYESSFSQRQIDNLNNA